MLKKNSLFNVPELSKTSRKRFIIRIFTKDVAVEGEMKGQFAYSLNADYQSLFANTIPYSDLFAKFGDDSLVTGIMSRRYYKGGGYLALPLEFRVMEDGSGNVYRASESLAKLVAGKDFNIKESAIAAAGVLNTIRQGGVDVAESALSLDSGALTTTITSFINKLANRSQARNVSVQIGDMFTAGNGVSNPMVITDLNVTYSKEFTHTGPLYADFSVKVETNEAMTKGKVAYFKRPEYNITVE